ncbi:hypothetical protein NFI96_002246 [Prochilodus magdalenae]|nr:hypothetical protein NFI96_002246 [Prochilodus magdalenae]
MKSLCISMWNIQGIKSSLFGYKSQNTEFINNIKNTDIIILQETWCKSDSVTHCPTNYKEIIIPSVKHTNTKKGRDSGGIIIWYKSELSKFITPLKLHKSHIWLKIKKEITDSVKDLFLCTVYIPPSESPYYDEDIFPSLHHQISSFQAQGSVLICGDLNARTGSLPDFTSEQGNRYIFKHQYLRNITHLPRYNSDPQVNRNGKDLLQLCQSLGLYIVNGRLRGDSLGRFTFCSALGNSTVDYMITDLDPFSLSGFTVKPLTPLSDHSQITVFINRTETNSTAHTQPSKLYSIRRPYRWAQNSPEEFQKAIRDPEIQTLLDTFLDTTYAHSDEGVDLAVRAINHVFIRTAQRSQLKLLRNKPKTPRDDKWFDSECQKIRNKLRNLSNQKHRDPNNADLRLQYCETLRHYKRTLRIKKAQHTHTQLTLIEESINTNRFWEHWNTLNKSKSEELVIQDGDIWTTHFKSLYNQVPNNTTPEQTNITAKLKALERAVKEFQNPLDSSITEQELTHNISKLKPKKASGPDGILPEMIRNTSRKFQSAILKLFNMILSVGYFPDIWSKGLITPIFKSGDKFDPNNYRGICVNSNLGKLLCSIINSRLLDFLMKHSVLSRSQIGFVPNHRTSDHIYTLHALIDLHVNQKKNKIFACFIDFKKAFDTIWHDGLFYKILESGVGGKTYDIIKSMYTNNKCGIKIGNRRTELFSQERGVRQGCCLSPTLFNIYINELATALERSAAPGLTLHDSEIKFLLYADDLVLLSPTERGLQQSLDLLEQYCQTWALAVNLKKTKTIIFQKRSRSQGNTANFTLGTHKLDTCKEFSYLGLKISSTGNFNPAVNELREKARRAFYAIKRQIHIQIPVQIWLKIFQSVIEPILLYGPQNHDQQRLQS